MQDDGSTSNGVLDEQDLRFDDRTAAEPFTPVFDAVLLDEDLSPVAKVVYALLAHHARKKGACWPGMERLQREAGVGETKLAAALNELRARGLVRSKRRGQGKTNLYLIFTPWGAAADPSPRTVPGAQNRGEPESRSVPGTGLVPRQARSEAEREKQIELLAPLVARDPEHPVQSAKDLRDALWSAFERALGRRPAGKVECARWAKGVQSLVGAATPEEVEQACAEYVRRYPELPRNPQAVAAGFSDYLQPRSMVRRPAAWDARYSARSRAGVEADELEELGREMQRAEERSRRGREGLPGAVGQDSSSLAAS